jgi:hypothetical protein
MVLPALVGMALLGSIQSYQDRVLACKPRRVALTVLCPKRRPETPARPALCERGAQPVPPRPTTLAMRDTEPRLDPDDGPGRIASTHAHHPDTPDPLLPTPPPIDLDVDPLRPVAVIEPEDSDGMIVIRPAPGPPDATLAATDRDDPALVSASGTDPRAPQPREIEPTDPQAPPPPNDALAASTPPWPLPAASEAVARLERTLKEQLRQAALAHRRARERRPGAPVHKTTSRDATASPERSTAESARVTRVAKPAPTPPRTAKTATRRVETKTPPAPAGRPRGDRTPPPPPDRAGRSDRNLMLILALQDEQPHVRKWAAELLGPSRDPRATQPLLGLLNDADWNVRRAALYALMQIGDDRAVGPLVEHLKSGSRKDKIVTALVLGRLRNHDATDALVAELTSHHAAEVKVSCAAALGELGDASAVAALRGVAKDAEKPVALACRRAVERLR